MNTPTPCRKAVLGFLLFCLVGGGFAVFVVAVAYALALRGSNASIGDALGLTAVVSLGLALAWLAIEECIRIGARIISRRRR